MQQNFSKTLQTVNVIGIVILPRSKWKTSVLRRHTSLHVGGPSSGDSCTVGNVPETRR